MTTQLNRSRPHLPALSGDPAHQAPDPGLGAARAEPDRGRLLRAPARADPAEVRPLEGDVALERGPIVAAPARAAPPRRRSNSGGAATLPPSGRRSAARCRAAV